ncbi:MAG: tetratricopeptide repeat protein [Nitrospirae bacterium]|nr:tetratricopeptide repeat protein [Candidatus Troglogloeales bacterium]
MSIVRRDIVGKQIFLSALWVFIVFTHAEPVYPETLPTKGEDDLFTMIPTGLIKSFQPVLDAYHKGDLDHAILETKQLAGKKALAETATSLLGDFYFRRWEAAGSGEGMELKDAQNALEMVLRKYPGTENADLALLKRGNLYLGKKQYVEASGSFTRVVARYPQTPYAASGQVGLLQSFRGLRRWDEVVRSYPLLAALNPSLANQQKAVFLYADALFELGRFEESYARYQFADALIPGSRIKGGDPELYFHYGEAAYRSGHPDPAKAIFQKVYKKFPDDPTATLAIALTSNIVRTKGDVGAAQELTDRIYLMESTFPETKVAKIIAATGRLASLNCPNPCESETVRQSIKHIEAESKSVFLDRPFTTTAQAAVLDGLMEMRRHISFDRAESLYGEMIPLLPALSPYLPFAESYLHQTVLEHFDSLEDPQKVVTLYHRFRKAFPPSKMDGEVGFKLAKSHMELGLLSDAIEYFRPIAVNVKYPKSEEAFYNMGTLLVQMGRYPEAQNVLEGFLARYPKRTDALLPLGNLYNLQGKVDLAINAYQKWLGYYPKHADRKSVYPKLAGDYRLKKKIDNEIKIYLQWIGETKQESERPYIGLADAYYEKKLYGSAIQYYQRALKVEKNKKELDWAKLRVGASYLALGRKNDAEKIFQEVAEQAKTPIIKKTAGDRDADLKAEKERLQGVARATPTKKDIDFRQAKAQEERRGVGTSPAQE